MRLLTIAAVGILSLTLVASFACGDDETPAATSTPSASPTSGSSVTPTPLPDVILSFETFLVGQNSGVVVTEPAAFTMKSQERWDQFWTGHQRIVIPTTTPPPFSFQDKMLIAVFDQEEPTGGYAIEVEAIRRVSGQIVVDAIRTIPGPSCIVTEALTQPFHIVSTDALEGELQLSLTDNVVDCS